MQMEDRLACGACGRRVAARLGGGCGRAARRTEGARHPCRVVSRAVYFELGRRGPGRRIGTHKLHHLVGVALPLQNQRVRPVLRRRVQPRRMAADAPPRDLPPVLSVQRVLRARRGALGQRLARRAPRRGGPSATRGGPRRASAPGASPGPRPPTEAPTRASPPLRSRAPARESDRNGCPLAGPSTAACNRPGAQRPRACASGHAPGVPGPLFLTVHSTCAKYWTSPREKCTQRPSNVNKAKAEER